MSDLTKEQAVAKIAILVNEAIQHRNAAKDLALEYNVAFDFHGETFYPTKLSYAIENGYNTEAEYLAEYEYWPERFEYDDPDDQGGIWTSSSDWC